MIFRELALMAGWMLVSGMLICSCTLIFGWLIHLAIELIPRIVRHFRRK